MPIAHNLRRIDSGNSALASRVRAASADRNAHQHGIAAPQAQAGLVRSTVDHALLRIADLDTPQVRSIPAP